MASVNNVPVRVDQLVDGGPLLNADGTPRVDDRTLAQRGVVVGYQTRQGRVAISRPIKDADGHPLTNADGTFKWEDEDDVIQGIVLLRKGQESLPALKDVLAKIDELNNSGRLLPGVQIVPFYNRTTLIDRTTETVQENLLVGMALVTAILLMFLGNVRAAIIVAINIPLALLFAFGVLYARNRSANLLSIGAVDFGIIVDSSVIVVESIYRHLTTHGTGQVEASAGERDSSVSGDLSNLEDGAGVPSVRRSELHVATLGQRVAAAAGEVQRSLFFATIIMVCALLPLFTMKGPEGQIFGPMADTYAFALGGALLLSMTLSPVLCLLLFKKLKAKPDNFLVRGLKNLFLFQLGLVLRFRWVALAAFLAIVTYTGAVAATMGREFMPELEEGNLLIRGTFPVNVSLEEVAKRSRQLRGVLQQFPEIAVIVPAIGRPDDGTDPTGYYNCETFVPLRPDEQWPSIPKYGRPRVKHELVRDLNETLDREFPGVDWDISQIIRDNVLEALSGVKGENSIKLFGPDLGTLEDTAFRIKAALRDIPGVQNAGVFRVQGQSNLEFPVDRQKCAAWKVSATDIQGIIEAAVGGKPATQVQEGEKLFPLVVRVPLRYRADESSILAIPVPVGNVVTPGGAATATSTPITGAAIGLSPTGTSLPEASVTGSAFNAPPLSTVAPRRRLGDLVTPLNDAGLPDESGSFLRRGASTIYREQGQRLIAVKF
ncbi:MAG TPA: efflux RND transporter permease subunit, partial [Gemmataceae bacterium]